MFARRTKSGGDELMRRPFVNRRKSQRKEAAWGNGDERESGSRFLQWVGVAVAPRSHSKGRMNKEETDESSPDDITHKVSSLFTPSTATPPITAATPPSTETFDLRAGQ